MDPIEIGQCEGTLSSTVTPKFQAFVQRQSVIKLPQKEKRKRKKQKEKDIIMFTLKLD